MVVTNTIAFALSQPDDFFLEFANIALRPLAMSSVGA